MFLLDGVVLDELPQRLGVLGLHLGAVPQVSPVPAVQYSTLQYSTVQVSPVPGLQLLGALAHLPRRALVAVPQVEAPVTPDTDRGQV